MKDRTRKELLTYIPNRITEYNRAHAGYNFAYQSFISSRSSGIAHHQGIETWLRSNDAGPCVRNLMDCFGMNIKGSTLISEEKFTASLQILPDEVNIKILSTVKIPTGGLSAQIDGIIIEEEIRSLFDFCARKERFSESGGFVIGSKVSHCIFPELCLMLDNAHIANALYNMKREEYLPPGDNWRSFLGRDEKTPVNPSPKGNGRKNWDCYRYTQAIAFYERIFTDWQNTQENSDLGKFLKLDPVQGTTGVPRIIDKVLW